MTVLSSQLDWRVPSLFSHSEITCSLLENFLLTVHTETRATPLDRKIKEPRPNLERMSCLIISLPQACFSCPYNPALVTLRAHWAPLLTCEALATPREVATLYS